MNKKEQVRWWIENETADRVIAQIIADRERIEELEAKLDRVRGVEQVHDSWNASDEFKDGWRECLEQVQSALGDEDE